MSQGATDAKEEDATVESLTRLFREHPAWRDAARSIGQQSKSNVYFTHRPGEAWHLERAKVGSDLCKGRVEDPDFVFRFSPAAVARLSEVEGGLGEFALELFSLIESNDPDEGVVVRVAAPIGRLREHGFLNLLFNAGPKVALYGLRRGVFEMTGLARLVRRATETPPYDWET